MNVFSQISTVCYACSITKQSYDLNFGVLQGLYSAVGWYVCTAVAKTTISPTVSSYIHHTARSSLPQSSKHYTSREDKNIARYKLNDHKSKNECRCVHRGLLPLNFKRNFLLRRGDDKSLARPGRKQATPTKLGVYSAYSL